MAACSAATQVFSRDFGLARRAPTATMAFLKPIGRTLPSAPFTSSVLGEVNSARPLITVACHEDLTASDLARRMGAPG